MMIPMQNWKPAAQDPFQAMVVDAVRTILPTVHTQINQARLNTLQFRQAAIRAADKSIKSGLEADKQFFELAQAMLPIAYKQVSRMRLSLLEIHKASISSLSQAMEQSLKTDQQLYEECLEILNKDSQQDQEQEVTVEDMESEVEVEVVPDEEIVEEEVAEEN